jgi:hypothetical protein
MSQRRVMVAVIAAVVLGGCGYASDATSPTTTTINRAYLDDGSTAAQDALQRFARSGDEARPLPANSVGGVSAALSPECASRCERHPLRGLSRSEQKPRKRRNRPRYRGHIGQDGRNSI